MQEWARRVRQHCLVSGDVSTGAVHGNDSTGAVLGYDTNFALAARTRPEASKGLSRSRSAGAADGLRALLNMVRWYCKVGVGEGMRGACVDA